MTTEYLVLGALLIVMGGVQTWLRHGPGAKTPEGADRSRQSPPGPGADDGRPRGPGADEGRPRGGVRSGRVWESWTAVLGGISVVLGIVLVILGVMGR